MSTTQERKPLFIPAIRAYMGDWIYYICCLKIRDAATRIAFADEIHTSSSLNDLIQRQLTNRAESIKKYLIDQPQRFFNALVVGVYGGDPEFVELSVDIPSHLKSSYEDSNLEGFLGYLVLTGKEKLFAIDGQHRIAGIRKAVNENKELGDEEICAVFVGHNNKDESGLSRTRRLFTTLNRYAKPVGKKDIIALDEDDVIAIITRQLVDDYSLFKNAISIKKGKNIDRSDKKNLTSIETLYDSLDFYFRKSKPKWKDYKKIRPTDQEIELFYKKSTKLFDSLKQCFPILKEYEKGSENKDRAMKYRNQQGGNILFRPIGFFLMIKIITYFTEDDMDLQEIGDLLAKVPLNLSHKLWLGLLWDNKNLRMITSKDNRTVAEKMLYYSLSGNLSRFKGWNEKKLRESLAGVLNKDPVQITLPKFV